MLLPLFMPSYLAYAGWGMLRGPGSWLGNWIGEGDPIRAVLVDRMLAIGGLSLWVWPLATIVLLPATRRVSTDLLDAIQLEPASAFAKARLLGRLLGPSLLGSTLLVGVVASGSAIPLHLAQVQTLSIYIWKFLSLAPASGSALIAGWPLILTAAVSAWALIRASSDRARLPDADVLGSRSSRLPLILGMAIWAVSVIGPVALFAANIRSSRSLHEFWLFSGDAFWNSLGIATASGIVLGLLGGGIAATRACTSPDSWERRALAVVAWLFVFVSLVPGIFVGLCTRAAWFAAWVPLEFGNGAGPVISAHIARFAALSVLVGWILGSSESAQDRDARFMAAGQSLRGWWLLRGWPSIMTLIGAGIAGAALSLHEIESTVQLQAAGTTSIAQYMLDRLHYARDEQLSAAGLNVLGTGLLLAIISSWSLTRDWQSRKL